MSFNGIALAPTEDALELKVIYITVVDASYACMIYSQVNTYVHTSAYKLFAFYEALTSLTRYYIRVLVEKSQKYWSAWTGMFSQNLNIASLDIY